MSEAKFTKGDWKLTSSNQNCSIVDANGEFVVAGEHDGAMVPFGAFKCKEEAIANAHLIAAAPEMYEFMEGLHESICINGGMVVIDSESIKFLEQLLAKARGEHA